MEEKLEQHRNYSGKLPWYEYDSEESQGFIITKKKEGITLYLGFKIEGHHRSKNTYFFDSKEKAATFKNESEAKKHLYTVLRLSDDFDNIDNYNISYCITNPYLEKFFNKFGNDKLNK